MEYIITGIHLFHQFIVINRPVKVHVHNILLHHVRWNGKRHKGLVRGIAFFFDEVKVRSIPWSHGRNVLSLVPQACLNSKMLQSHSLCITVKVLLKGTAKRHAQAVHVLKKHVGKLLLKRTAWSKTLKAFQKGFFQQSVPVKPCTAVKTTVKGVFPVVQDDYVNVAQIPVGNGAQKPVPLLQVLSFDEGRNIHSGKMNRIGKLKIAGNHVK